MLTLLTAYEAMEDKYSPGFLFFPPKMLLPCCLLKCLLQKEIAYWPSTGGKRSTSLLVSGSSLVSLAPAPAPELVPFVMRRLLLIHVFKSREYIHGKPIRWKLSKATMPCSENAAGEINSKIILFSIFQLMSSFNHLSKPKLFPPFRLTYLI